MNIFRKTIRFLQEVKIELGRVSWSNRKELIGATSVVIMLTFIMAIFIGIIDIILSRILKIMFK